jgi:ATP-dependent helicase/nuclease subunit B
MSGLFDAPGPRWFTIAAHRPFVEDLAAGLLAALGGDDPEALADCTVLTPTRRGARALADGFVRAAGGRAVLLPQILALGDLDEGEPPFEPGDLALDLPPAVAPLRRRFELARLVAAHQDLFERDLDAAAALELGDALAGFLDSMQIEEIADPGRLDALVEGDLARHWLRSAEFLRIATVAWPRRLAELGLMDVTERRAALLRALAERWRADPPPRPLVAAGSTGSAPATADLLRIVAAAPLGAVVLPGLDLDLADDAWDQVGEGHPQRTMRLLLDRAGVGRAEVRPWPGAETTAAALRGRSRRRVINEALRPAEATGDWVQVIGSLRAEGAAAGIDPIAEGLEGLSLVTARTEEDAAGAAAVLLRETLETPGRTAALVTPDMALARRVSARLARWGVAVDSSAGVALAATAPGTLAALVAGAAADPLSPTLLLSILKHPLVRLGRDVETLARERRVLERRALRGPRPASWEALRERLAPRQPPTPAEGGMSGVGLAEDLEAALALAAFPFADGPTTAGDAARGLAEAMEALCAPPEGGAGALWAGPAGEAAAGLLAALMDEATALPPADAGRSAALIERLLASQVVRSGGAAHPRLRILGAIEARLVRADRLVLAGLEEGVWPRPPAADPFLSRPMRARLGLPPPERRIGLSAHDFAQAAGAPDVILINVERRDGQPAVKSRWLWRLETLAKGAGLALPRRDDALAWSRALDAALAAPPPELAPARGPEPRPPVAARPRGLFVTQVETWVRDPYAVYARQVLKLRALAPPDERVEVRIRGTAIHAAFEVLAEDWPVLAPDAADAFAGLYIQALRDAGAPEPSLARETVLAARAGAWVADFERRRREAGVTVLVERQGALAVPGADFTVSAKCDRLEIGADAVHVLDFKTGRAPSAKEMETGFSPQLTLTAAIAAGGGFPGVAPRPPGELVYVRVTGREPAGEEHLRAEPGESAALAEAALAGLAALVVRYDDEAQPYRSRIAPRFVKAYPGDYDHLARVREWSTGDDEDDG